MTPDSLESLSDQALSEVFACEVAGWKQFGDHSPAWGCRTGLPPDDVMQPCRPFSTSADAVLPFLEKHFVETEWCSPGQHHPNDPDGHQWRIRIPGVLVGADGRAPTFARAACLALIKAHRAAKAP